MERAWLGAESDRALLLFRGGWPKPGTSAGWLGVALLIAGTLCQIWASVRWIG